MQSLTKIMLAIGLLFLFSVTYAANITASVDRNPVALGQTFHLVINLPKNSISASPDTSVLAPTFQVLSMSQNQAVNIVNNRISRKNQLIITLIARQLGNLIIPSIKIGTDQTRPIKIKIASRQQIQQAKNRPVFINADLETKNPYVQSEVLYTVKIYYNQSLGGASLTPPRSQSAIIKRLGRDLTYQAYVKGRLYHVFQRSYAIFPQKSGKQTILPPVFRAEISTDNRSNSSGNNFFGGGFFNMDTQPIELTAPLIKMQVKAMPGNFSNKKGMWWLPAKKITLTQSWSQSPQQMRVGQPITRLITVKAKGLTAAQLPDLKLNIANNGDFNRYPSQPELKNTLVKHHLMGIRTEKIVYIPTKKGQINLPAIKLTWWNTQTNKSEQAIIPAQQISVLAALANQKNNTPIQQQANSKQVKEVKAESTAAANTNTVKVATASKLNLAESNSTIFNSLLIKIAVGCIFFIGIGFLIWFLFRTRSNKSAAETKPSSNTNFELRTLEVRKIKKQLKQACLANDPKQARNILLQWAKLKWPNITFRNLGDIQQLIMPEVFSKALAELDKQLYTQNSSAWDGQVFWESFRTAHAELKLEAETGVSSTTELPELYLKN